MRKDIRSRKPTHASQSTLFLIELIISVAFMALSSTVCVRLYLYAHELSEYSAFRTHAVTEVQNLFTAFRTGSAAPEDTLKTYLETVSFSGDTPAPSALSASSVLSAVGTSAAAAAGPRASSSSSLISTGTGSAAMTLAFDRNWNLVGYESAGQGDSPLSGSCLLTLTWSEDPGTPGMKILTADFRDEEGNPERTYHAECRRYIPQNSGSSEAKSSAASARSGTGSAGEEGKR